MKRLLAVALFCPLLALAATKVAKSSSQTAPCQAVLQNGNSCPCPAEKGRPYCRRHRGLSPAPASPVSDSSPKKKGKEGWQGAKAWTTNAWEQTKSGTREAWQATSDAFREAGEEFGKLFGGQKKAK